MRRRTFIAASLGSLVVRPPLTLVTRGALAFGTTISVAVLHDDAAQAGRAIDAALSAAAGVDRLMSIYDARSQVFQLNRDGVVARPDARLVAVLAQARALALLTRGAFDITVQPLWQACHDADPALVATLERGTARERVDWRAVRVQAARVALGKHGMGITLNGLAQGYAADLALAALKAHGIEHALLDTGEFAACGHKSAGLPWTVGVADPREAGALAASLALDGRCLATSGDYASTFTPDFLHHHIFDPATGYSPRELASVTVLAPSAMLADGLSTAFMVMGAKKSHALAARLDKVDLMTINKRGLVWKSPGFPAAA